MADAVNQAADKAVGTAKNLGTSALSLAWKVAPYVLIVGGVGVALNPALAAGAIAPITGGAQGIAAGVTTGVQSVSAYTSGTGAAAAGVTAGTPSAVAAGNGAAGPSVGGVQSFALGME